jgi:hypothetical protein
MVKRYFSGQATDEQPDEISLEGLLNKATKILRTDLMYLTQESTKGKLSPAAARDLVAYVKLLSELKADQNQDLSKLTIEQLKALADDK